MTLVQHAGTTSTVSGPAALSTYRSASESLHPAQAEVHFSTYSSLGISAMVSNSCSDSKRIGEREMAIVDLSLFITTAGEKSIRSGPAIPGGPGQSARNTRRPSTERFRFGWALTYSSRTLVTEVAMIFIPPRCASSSGVRLRFFKQLSTWYPVSPSV